MVVERSLDVEKAACCFISEPGRRLNAQRLMQLIDGGRRYPHEGLAGLTGPPDFDGLVAQAAPQRYQGLDPLGAGRGLGRGPFF